MGGLTWSLIQARGAPAEHLLEFAANGVYDPIRKRVRYHGGPHSGSLDCLEYNEVTNQWSRCPNPREWDGWHGYDQNAIDPATGDHYVRLTGESSLWRWNGSSWSRTSGNRECVGIYEPAIGMAWDEARNGVITFNDSGGVCLWSKTTDTWTYLGHPPGVSGSYHFLAEYHPAAKLMWLQDANGRANHWKLDSGGKITSLKPPPLNLGCCGSGAVMSAYDYGSGKMIVADPFRNRWYEFDILNDTWQSFTNTLPLDNTYDISSIEGIVTTISAYKVLLYVMARGTGGAPEAYLYKHR